MKMDNILTDEQVNPQSTYYLRLRGRRTFMCLVEDIRSYLCPEHPGAQDFETGGYSFFNLGAGNYVVHYLEPACRRPCETVRAVRLTTREDPKAIEVIAREIHARLIRKER